MTRDDARAKGTSPAVGFTTVEQLGAIVAARRSELGITQARLARRCGVSRQWVVRFEGGANNVETGLALRVLRALDLHLELTVTSQVTPRNHQPHRAPEATPGHPLKPPRRQT